MMLAASFTLSTAMLAACGNGETPPGPDSGPVYGQTNEDKLATDPSTGSLSAKGMFNPDFASFEEEQQAAKRLAVEIAEEGDVLLKNANNALPLGKDEKNITLFGMTSVHLIEAGGGSGAGTLGNNGIAASTLESALTDAGFRVNKKTLDLYEKFEALGTEGELPMSEYANTVTSTYRSYNDAAIITLGRVGAENSDCATNNVPGHADEDEHYLQLDDNERALVKHVKEHFDKVIVLINSANVMQIPDLAAEKTADNLGVDAILWVSTTGNNAIDAVGSILNGTVNPSGHTVDIWAKDFKKDPTWTNFGWQTQNKDAQGNRMDAFYYDEDGNQTKYTSVEYREDIYLGYKYYETVYDEKNAAGQDGASWYDSSVLYPFGYGLSYTDFRWELIDTEPLAKIDAYNQTVTVKVKVTNIGSYAGKDVVQLYYSAPYTPGGIEKASANLVAFEKTEELAPGESEVLTIQFVAEEMASYDYDDINNNGFAGWELEGGDYQITARRDSHTPVLSVTRHIDEGIKCETDYVTGLRQDPVFVDDYTSVNSSLLDNKLSRTDLVNAPQPEAASVEDRTIPDVDIKRLDSQDTYDVWRDQETDPWYKSAEDIPDDWTQALPDESDPTGFTPMEEPEIKMCEMAGVPKDDHKWVEFMNQLTWATISDLVANGADVSIGSPAIPSVDKAADAAADGPVQIRGGTLFAGAGITAATFNKELAYEQGRMIGNDAIFTGNNGWLGSGMNIHRSPFGGRNFEYYSEDGMLSALIAAEVIKGVTDKGVVAYIKHYFANDQETYRAQNGGIATWATEQALREIYARPFEYAIKKGGSMGIMSSFNRIGYAVTSNSYAAMTELLRNQFGFTGTCYTDMWTRDYCPIDLMIRAGNDQVLANGDQYPKNDITHGEWDPSVNCVRVPANASEEAAGKNTVISYTHYYAVRNCAQNILYAHVNSLGNKNGYSDLGTEITLVRGVQNSVAVNIEGLKDVSVADAETMAALPGMSISGGIVTGTPAESIGYGTYSVPIDLTIDGWVEYKANLTVNVVSAIRVNGKNVSTDDHVVGTVAQGDTFTATIDAPYYAYGNQIAASRFANQIVNWWHSPSFHAGEGASQKGRFNRPEDFTAADILVRDPSQFDDLDEQCTVDGCKIVPITADLTAYGAGTKTYMRGEYGYEIIGANEAGFEIEDVAGTVTGMSGQTYQANTTATLTLDTADLEPGNYSVYVMVRAPWTTRQNVWLLTNRGNVGIYFYVQEITITVT